MPLFDRYVFADYSGQQDDGPQRAAISLWIADHGAEPHPETNDGAGFTRSELRLFIEEYLAAATRDGCRVVFGTDHQWSWPRSLWAAAGLPDGTWRERIQSLVHGADLRPALTINTTTVNYAPAFNDFVYGDTHGGPFYIAQGNGQYVGHGMPNGWQSYRRRLRITELDAGGGYSATEFGQNRVAGQTIRGLPQLHALLTSCEHQGIPLACWPFDGMAVEAFPANAHVGLEVYPSLYPQDGWDDVQQGFEEVTQHDRDAWRTCQYVRQLDLAEELADVLNLAEMPMELQAAVSIEGWILGVPPYDEEDQ